jgi:hypothetical protein
MESSPAQLVDLAAKIAGRLLRDVSDGGAQTVQMAFEADEFQACASIARFVAPGDTEKGALAE